MNVTLDLEETKRREKLLKLFKEIFDYQTRAYKTHYLPVSMFDADQSEYIKENYFVRMSKNKKFYRITSKA